MVDDGVQAGREGARWVDKIDFLHLIAYHGSSEFGFSVRHYSSPCADQCIRLLQELY